MAKDCFRHIAVDAAIGAGVQRQPQQRQWVEGVGGRCLQRHAQVLPQPLGMAVRPQAFGGNARWAGVAVLLQQRTQQHGAVADVYAQTL